MNDADFIEAKKYYEGGAELVFRTEIDREMLGIMTALDLEAFNFPKLALHIFDVLSETTKPLSLQQIKIAICSEGEEVPKDDKGFEMQLICMMNHRLIVRLPVAEDAPFGLKRHGYMEKAAAKQYSDYMREKNRRLKEIQADIEPVIDGLRLLSGERKQTTLWKKVKAFFNQDVRGMFG